MSDSADVLKSKNAERDKTADKLAATQPILSSSICLKCVSHRTVVSGKRSVFILCNSDNTPSNWPKYPGQPMKLCRFFCSNKF